MDEAVLRRKVGGSETMYAQLQRLIQASALPNVTLLVMPDSLGAHPGLDGPLAILQFETGTRPVAYVEGRAVTSTWRKTTISPLPADHEPPPRRRARP